MLLILSTLFVFFSGTTFTLNLLWWIIATALYYGLTLPVVAENQIAIKGLKNFSPVLTTTFYITQSVLIGAYGIILLIGSYFQDITSRKRFLQRILMHKQQGQIIKEKTKNEDIQRNFLENILPSTLVGKLQMQQEVKISSGSFRTFRALSQTHAGVSMLFADLVGFTAFSAQVDPFKVMIFLNDLFQIFDGMCDQYNVYKLETVGDCYVATVGVVTGELLSTKMLSFSTVVNDSMKRRAALSNAKDLIGFAKAMLGGSRQVLKPVLNTPAIMRIGIHTGSCMSGIVGTRKLKFCLLGDMTVKAAQMEKYGRPDLIHASQEMVDLVPGESWEARSEEDQLKMSTSSSASNVSKTYWLRVV